MVLLRNDTIPWSINPININTVADTAIKYYHWDFGNGVTSDSPQNSIIYNTPGTYNITYTTLNSKRDTVIYQQTIVFKEAKVSDRNENIIQDINIYPNPGKGNYTLKTYFVNNYSIDIFNMYGELLKSFVSNSAEQQVNIENFSSGVYTFIIRQNNGISQSIKVIKE